MESTPAHKGHVSFHCRADTRMFLLLSCFPSDFQSMTESCLSVTSLKSLLRNVLGADQGGKGAEKMPQWLRVRTALTDDPHSIPSSNTPVTSGGFNVSGPRCYWHSHT